MPLLGQGCSPVISGFQTARIVPEGESEIMPIYAATYSRRPGYRSPETLFAYHAIGVRTSGRLSARREFQIGYARLIVPRGQGDAPGANVAMFGIKRSLAEDFAALVLPAGVWFNSYGIGVSLQPAIVLTVPVTDHVDINPALSAIISPIGLVNVDVNFAVGAALSDKSRRFVLRPEVGLLVSPSDRGVQFTAGVGLTVRRSTRPRKQP